MPRWTDKNGWAQRIRALAHRCRANIVQRPLSSAGVFVAAFVLFLAAVRYETRILSFAIAAVVALPLAVASIAAVPPRDSLSRGWAPMALATLAGAAGYLALLVVYWSPSTRGMPVWCFDLIRHLVIQNNLTLRDPHEYAGAVSFHTAAALLDKLGVSRFAAYRSLYFLLLASCFVFPFALVSAEGGRAKPLASSVLAISLLATLGVAVATIVLPFVHVFWWYGYAPQLFGLLPLFAGALAVAFWPTVLGRLIVLGMCVVALRYTYVLHLGDACLVFAAVAFTEIPGRRLRWQKFALLSLGQGAITAAVAASVVLSATIRPEAGWIPPYDIDLLRWDVLLLGVFLLLAPEVLRAFGVGKAAALSRMMRVPGFFCVASVTSLTVLDLAQGISEYYRTKFMAEATLVGTLAGVALVASTLCATALEWRSIRGQSGGRPSTAWAVRFAPAAAAVIAIWGGVVGARIARDLAPYRKLLRSYVDHKEDVVPYAVDPIAWGHIERVLREQQAKFAGLMSPNDFESAWAFQVLRPDIPYVERVVSRSSIGQDECLFWFAPEDYTGPSREGQDWVIHGKNKTASSVLHAREPKTCVEYDHVVGPRTRAHLCWRCGS